MTKTRDITDIDMTVRFVQRQQLKKELDNNIHDWLHSYTQMIKADAITQYKYRWIRKVLRLLYISGCALSFCGALGILTYLAIYWFTA